MLVYHRPGCGACAQCLAGGRTSAPARRASASAGPTPTISAAGPTRRCPCPTISTGTQPSSSACQGGTAYAPLRRLGASGRDTLVVSGLGPVGLCAVALGRAMGATIIGIDPMAERRVLGERFGAALTIDPLAGDPAAQVRDAAPGASTR